MISSQIRVSHYSTRGATAECGMQSLYFSTNTFSPLPSSWALSFRGWSLILAGEMVSVDLYGGQSLLDLGSGESQRRSKTNLKGTVPFVSTRWRIGLAFSRSRRMLLLGAIS